MSDAKQSREAREASGPRAVVVPFDVPEDGRGLGLGLAALLHHFARAFGENVALAQLLKKSHGSASERPTPVEAFLGPDAWRELEGRGDAPRGVRVVITGGFEPPTGAAGQLELMAFEPLSGKVLASAETTLDEPRAGKQIAEIFERLWRDVGGELDLSTRIGDLEWDPLQSVLYAERDALYDPLRAAPHDRLAALIHLGRAVEESPASRYPAGRLAHLALEAAAIGDRKLAEASHRALARAAADAPNHIDLVEARAALELRLGACIEAEAAALSALARAPKRSRLFALVSEARRSRGDDAGARAILEDGFARAGTDPILLNERGTLAAASGDMAAARDAWIAALAFDPIFPPAFLNLAAFAMQEKSELDGQRLVDRVLSPTDTHPDLLRRALVLALTFEPEGIARAARLVRIGDRLLAHAPNDAWALLTTAHALVALDERDEARRRFSFAARVAQGSSLAAEASRGLFALEQPQAAAEVDSVLRAARTAEERDLPAILARSRALAAAHDVWPARFALGLAERRSGNGALAYVAFEQVLTQSPECVDAHLELSSLGVELDRPIDAVAHAERAFDLTFGSRDAALAVAEAYRAAGQIDDAKNLVARLLAARPNDENVMAMAKRLDAIEAPAPESFAGRLVRRLSEKFGR